MQVENFYNLLIQNGIECFCGVPDSLLKSFCAYVSDNAHNHTITANEGNAIGLAAGNFLATGKPACVYMQNSGLGNCVNPLLSLTDEEVYNIPLLMLIGWRGEPGQKDEPQHVKQGKVTDKLLEVMGIEYSVLPDDIEEAKVIINAAFVYMTEYKKPYALIIKKGLFDEYNMQNKSDTLYKLGREEAIENVLRCLTIKDVIVSTTGHISREVYEIREKYNQSHKQDFLTVGSMGHASSIALGIALNKQNRNVYCFDGDGAFLMHLGSMIVNLSKNLDNFKHIVFNNEAHDSVGAQPTAIGVANLVELAAAGGFKYSYSVSSIDELLAVLPKFISERGPSFLEIKVKCGARKDLGRPKETPIENKNIFMENLCQIDYCHRGAISNLSKILKVEDVGKALVFTGKKSFENFKSILDSELKVVSVTYYNNFSPNPKIEEVDIAKNVISKDFDIIIAVGGGSVIDFAKAFRYYSKSKVKLIAIPTTCGTGAESTQFAVIYENGVKKSLDNAQIIPDYAIADSQFVENNPRYLKACTAMDAFCQAIESYWAVKSTSESRNYAKQAIILCRDNIVSYVNSEDISASLNMMKASHLAGKAINISRTTVAHALSYKITSDYKIPHGHAVSLTIAKLIQQNSHITNESLNDSRGMLFVQDRLKEIRDLLRDDPVTYFASLYGKIGLVYETDKLGINDKKSIISSINIERLSNNPKILSQEELFSLL